jgi:GGDEF domain-containing protein
VENGLFWALAAAGYGLAMPTPPVIVNVTLMTAMLVFIVSAVETSYRLAFRDELTGLPGRRALNEALANLSGTYGVAMVDIDHFKRFNDRFGHDVGDQALRMVAARLTSSSRTGKVFRYGGEEFAVLFPGRTRAETLAELEKMRQTVAGAEFIVRHRKRPRQKPAAAASRRQVKPNRRVQVTVSIGAAAPTDARDKASAVLKAADQALYRAKKAGRNRVRM